MKRNFTFHAIATNKTALIVCMIPIAMRNTVNCVCP